MEFQVTKGASTYTDWAAFGRDIRMETKRFQKAIQNKVKRMKAKDVPAFLDETTFAVIEGVVPRTPVQYGRARSGWRKGAEGVGYPWPRIPTKKGTGVRAAIAQALGAKEGSFKKSWWYREVVNGVPYIVGLEIGASARMQGGILRPVIRQIASRMTGKRKERAKDILKKGLAK